MTAPFPLTVRLDRDAQRLEGGRVLLAGSPTVLFRLGRRGQQVVDAIERGEPPEADARPLIERLLDTGAAHPVVDSIDPASHGPRMEQVTVVVPAYGAVPAGLAEAFAGTGGIVVVDDASPRPILAPAATVIRHPTNQGPAAARNTGIGAATTELVACTDTDCQPSAQWIAQVLPHFADPRVALVAPRITSPAGPGAGLLARYEAARSPLDLGDRPARVAPASRVAYVPGAAFVARRSAVLGIGGFDSELRVGEDVDLAWRLHAAGWRVRYEPSATVRHAARTDLAAMVRQRFAYGTSAGPLARRHGAAVAPVRASRLSLAAWAACASGHPVAASALGLGSALSMARRIRPGRHELLAAFVVATRAHLASGRQLARALTRPWWPLAATVGLLSRRARPVVVAAALLPALVDHRRERPGLDVASYVGLRLLDDVAYGAGVWWGAAAQRRLEPLTPRRDSGRRGPRSSRRR